MYVHVPFCARRCDYCAFATWTDRDDLMDDYVEACLAELHQADAAGELPPASSVFFGGGTPSRLPPEAVAAVLGRVPRTPCAEVTVECNPEDASVERFEQWVSAGVGRVSFGVQSMVPHVLDGLGRSHDPAAVEAAVGSAARAGLASVNVDVIFGGAGESDADWLATLEGVLRLDPRPQHVSAYALTVEPGTVLAADPVRHPDDDVQADRYLMADSVLSAAGYRWYEVSNWALAGYQCRHNRLYWAQGDYRGIGCAAHSHRAGRRWWNVRTPERYIATVRSGRSPMAAGETLSAQERMFERLALALRTAEGVPAEVVPDLPELRGLVRRSGDRAVLTPRGRLMANAVTATLRTVTERENPAGILPE